MTDFAEIVENQLGIKTEEDFSAWQQRLHDNGVTQADLDLLDPDKIDNKAFWKYITTRFSRGVCGDKRPNTVEERLRMNARLSASMGVFGFLYNLLEAGYTNLVEIGCGDGVLKQWCGNKFWYSGFDIVPQTEGINEIEDGKLPPKEELGETHIVVSFNTFQHLSFKQRETYVKQIADLLVPTGCFIVSCNEKPVEKYNYSMTYGQVVPLGTLRGMYELLEKYGFAISQTNHRWSDGMYTIFAFKKPDTVGV